MPSYALQTFAMRRHAVKDSSWNRRLNPRVSVIECFETDGGVNYRSDWLIFFNLCGFRLMLQATFLDGVPFDPFSFQQDSWATSEVDVGRR